MTYWVEPPIPTFHTDTVMWPRSMTRPHPPTWQFRVIELVARDLKFYHTPKDWAGDGLSAMYGQVDYDKLMGLG